MLDGFRLVAALMVVAYHFIAFDRGAVKPWGVGATEAFPWLSLPASYGWLGVEFFFLISGFVICMSAWGRTIGAFFRSRVVRLYPAYWASIALTFAVLTAWPVIRRPVGTSDALLNLTMLHEPMGVRPVDAVYWTLWAEARFYLLFALVIWRGLSYRRAMLFCFGWLLVSAIAADAGVPLLTLAVQPSYAPYFIAGIAFFLIHRFGSHPLTWLLVVASWLMAQHYLVAEVRHVGDAILQRPLPLVPALAVVSGIFALMAAVALRRLSWMRWRWLTVAGALTYPLYLLHENIGWTMITGLRPFLPRYVTLTIVVAAMLLAAWLVHRYTERPVAGLLRRGLNRPLPR